MDRRQILITIGASATLAPTMAGTVSAVEENKSDNDFRGEKFVVEVVNADITDVLEEHVAEVDSLSPWNQSVIEEALESGQVSVLGYPPHNRDEILRTGDNYHKISISDTGRETVEREYIALKRDPEASDTISIKKFNGDGEKMLEKAKKLIRRTGLSDPSRWVLTKDRSSDEMVANAERVLIDGEKFEILRKTMTTQLTEYTYSLTEVGDSKKKVVDELVTDTSELKESSEKIFEDILKVNEVSEIGQETNVPSREKINNEFYTFLVEVGGERVRGGGSFEDQISFVKHEGSMYKINIDKYTGGC
ncbi:hypothetical protein [Haloparvum sp. AD34]